MSIEQNTTADKALHDNKQLFVRMGDSLANNFWLNRKTQNLSTAKG